MDKVTFVTKPTKKARSAELVVKRALKSVKKLPAIPLVIAVGGDGTMLMAVKKYQLEDVMFVGISAGTLGLLQAVDVEQIPQLAEALTKNTYALIKSPLLEASVCKPAENSALEDEITEVIGYGFNEVSVERQGPRAAKFHLKIDGSSGSFVGDGVIFATPLGSTAYSMAAGGPVVDTKIKDVFIATPNNPHFSILYSSLQSPHVLDKGRRVRIEINREDVDERPAQLSIDGQVILPKITQPVNIGLSDRSINLLQLAPGSLHNRINNKRLGRL